jgi:hypothetical protein
VSSVNRELVAAGTEVLFQRMDRGLSQLELDAWHLLHLALMAKGLAVLMYKIVFTRLRCIVDLVDQLKYPPSFPAEQGHCRTFTL